MQRLSFTLWLPLRRLHASTASRFSAPALRRRTYSAHCPRASRHATLPESGNAEPNLLAWSQDLEANLVAEKFDDLDQIANQLRRDKTRLRGGDWKLAVFYNVLDRPLLDDKDSVDHLEHLRHWMTARPESITARIALARSLHRWAWVARGNGFPGATPSLRKWRSSSTNARRECRPRARGLR